MHCSQPPGKAGPNPQSEEWKDKQHEQSTSYLHCSQPPGKADPKPQSEEWKGKQHEQKMI